jgi:hypothetical protein
MCQVSGVDSSVTISLQSVVSSPGGPKPVKFDLTATSAAVSQVLLGMLQYHPIHLAGNLSPRTRRSPAPCLSGPRQTRPALDPGDQRWSVVGGLLSVVSGLQSVVGGLMSVVSGLQSVVGGLLSVVSGLQSVFYTTKLISLNNLL